MNLYFARAKPEDADALIRVQNAAFAEDVRRYGRCPSYIDDRAVIVNKIESAIFYKIVLDGAIVGGIEIHPRSQSHYHLYMLCVDPDHHNRSIGTRALRFIFGRHPEARLWTLVTPMDNQRNCHLYEKAGFRRVGEIVESEALTLVRYRKER